MKKYAVHYQDSDDDSMHIYFCRAENTFEAEEKCYGQHPNAIIIDVTEENDAPEELFETAP